MHSSLLSPPPPNRRDSTLLFFSRRYHTDQLVMGVIGNPTEGQVLMILLFIVAGGCGKCIGVVDLSLSYTHICFIRRHSHMEDVFPP